MALISNTFIHPIRNPLTYTIVPHQELRNLFQPSPPCYPAIVAYLEPQKSGPVIRFFKNLQGSLPIVGLVSRLASDDGEVGSDRLCFPEFYNRVDRSLPPESVRAFDKFSASHGKAGRKSFVLLWCWAATVGAGLVKSEDLTMAAKRLRFSHDTEYEIDKLDTVMDENLKRRAKSKQAPQEVPFLLKVQKALELTWICSIGGKPISDDEAELLESMFVGIFPAVDRSDLQEIIENLAAIAESKAQNTKVVPAPVIASTNVE